MEHVLKTERKTGAGEENRKERGREGMWGKGGRVDEGLVLCGKAQASLVGGHASGRLEIAMRVSIMFPGLEVSRKR